MSEVSGAIQAWNQYYAEDLAEQLSGLVEEHHDVLAETLPERNILGPLQRYKDRDTALQSVERGLTQHESGTNTFFTVVKAGGRIAGIGSITHEPLRELHVPIPPRLALPPLSSRQRNAGANVKAWTYEGSGDIAEHVPLLASAYRNLGRYLELGAGRSRRDAMTYTIEPARTGLGGIHDAIRQSGFADVRTARFDDLESRAIPPTSTLYVIPPREQAHLNEHELRDQIRGDVMHRIMQAAGFLHGES